MPLADQLVRASLERFRDLFAEPKPRSRDPVAADELPIEPGRAVACHLLIQVVAGEDFHVRLATALGVVSQGALLVRNEPAVRAETLNDPRPLERLQAAHMAVDEGVGVRPSREPDIAKVDQLAMVGRPVLPNPLRQLGDGPVGRAQVGFSASQDDAADARLLGDFDLPDLDMMDAPVHAIDHEADAVAEFVDQPLADQPAHHRLAFRP
jgi:hypothetical protein